MRYFVKMRVNVGGENDAILIAALTEEELERVKKSKVCSLLFQIEEEPVSFEKAAYKVTSITEEEYEVLRKLYVFEYEGIYFIDENGEEYDPCEFKCFESHWRI